MNDKSVNDENFIPKELVETAERATNELFIAGKIESHVFQNLQRICNVANSKKHEIIQSNSVVSLFSKWLQL